ncbi:hypothetical protein O6P43_026198 [Quillaja saponaria]|uniref:Uncharacterized protein n=1 Tax=Quillaja saponaria TaxID=32244 RepID=A0AAD7PH49_QUISA|nr:hypothetical protein O6P43_026198 [Quillaja saponaria]
MPLITWKAQLVLGRLEIVKACRGYSDIFADWTNRRITLLIFFQETAIDHYIRLPANSVATKYISEIVHLKCKGQYLQSPKMSCIVIVYILYLLWCCFVVL